MLCILKAFCVKTCTLLLTNKLNTASSICNCIADRQRPGPELTASAKSCFEVLFTLLSLKVGLLESTGLNSSQFDVGLVTVPPSVQAAADTATQPVKLWTHLKLFEARKDLHSRTLVALRPLQTTGRNPATPSIEERG